MRDAAAVTAEDGSGRVNSAADNLRDWSRLVSQTLQGVDWQTNPTSFFPT